jgi:hypothetical protein
LLQNAGTGDSVCLFRIHHTLADGLSIATLFVRDILKSCPDGIPLSQTGTSAFLPPTMMSQKSSSLENHRTKLSWATQIYRILDCVQQVFLLPLTPFDDPTTFSQGCQPKLVHSGKRAIVLMPTIPLKLVQAIKNAAQVTVNDVIFTCMSQAIHDYCKQQQCPILQQKGTNLQCRSLLATALPRSMENATMLDLLQNQWFLWSVDLGVGCSPSNDILERLDYIHNTFHRLKASPLAFVGLFIQNRILKYFPLMLNQMLVHGMMSRHSLCISNVPGPQRPVMMANREVKGLHVLMSNLCPQAMFASYRGKVYGNIVLDPDLLPNGKALARYYREAMMSLAERLKVPLPEEMP